ncbi:hypothetical protein KQI65_16025 [bacterium]|nr:hypothetical protein [bacterium]
MIRIACVFLIWCLTSFTSLYAQCGYAGDEAQNGSYAVEEVRTAIDDAIDELRNAGSTDDGEWMNACLRNTLDAVEAALSSVSDATSYFSSAESEAYDANCTDCEDYCSAAQSDLSDVESYLYDAERAVRRALNTTDLSEAYHYIRRAANELSNAESEYWDVESDASSAVDECEGDSYIISRPPVRPQSHGGTVHFLNDSNVDVHIQLKYDNGQWNNHTLNPHHYFTIPVAANGYNHVSVRFAARSGEMKTYRLEMNQRYKIAFDFDTRSWDVYRIP